MNRKIYLDYAASTPVDKKVLKAMMPYLRNNYGNPSSAHAFGQKARAAVEQAREEAAKFLHCSPLEIVFTSGATEANNLAIRGIARNFQFPISNFQSNPNDQIFKKLHIITTAIEHESVLEPCRTLEKPAASLRMQAGPPQSEGLGGEGVAEVTYVAPDKDGLIRAEDIEKAMELLYKRKKEIKDFSFIDSLTYTIATKNGFIFVTKDLGFKGLPNVELIAI